MQWLSIDWHLGRSTDVFNSKKQPSKAKYKKKVVLRIPGTIRTNHNQPFKSNYLKHLFLIAIIFVYGID